jgi:hypothetical protein
MAERLRAAFDAGDLDLLAPLLHPDVRWGNCHNRDQVLEWYGVLRAHGMRARVSETQVHGDSIVLGVTVSGQVGTAYQTFRVEDDLVVEIRNSA